MSTHELRPVFDSTGRLMASVARVQVCPAQAHWPSTRMGVISDAIRCDNGKWPEQLTSGVMFHMGERITRAEFEAAASLATKEAP